MFFELQPRRAILTDMNPELVNAFRVVKIRPNPLLQLLEEHERNHNGVPEDARQTYYYRMRDLDPDKLSDTQRAARFIYLNRTCYNGLYRVNSEGKFNVPIGNYDNPRVCDRDLIIRVQKALLAAEIRCEDFRAMADEVGEGDFVFCDPPYIPLSQTASFTSYTASDFGFEEHRALAALARKWAKRGAMVLITNSDTPMTRELYSDPIFRSEVVNVPRAINRNANGRQPIAELAIYNYDRKRDWFGARGKKVAIQAQLSGSKGSHA